jgi:mono/diheme cytochrome c family protein
MLKKFFKWAGIILLVLIIALSITVSFRQNLKFDAPYPDVKATTDSAVLARGKYLVYGPAHCADCHASPATAADVNKGVEVPLGGGVKFELPIGNICPPNISPDEETGIAKLSDGQVARALRYGVGHDGRALVDFMPFHNTSDADLTAIISYLRTMPAVKNKTENNSFNLMGKLVKAFLITPVYPTGEVLKTIVPDSSVAYGKYLANSVANCRGCHTERDMKTGAFVGKDYAGGFEMESLLDKNFIFHTPNITPDKTTGHIYSWDEAIFLRRFRQGKLYPQTPMPWGPFGRMSDMEIKAIYRYLHTITPVERKIEKIVEEKK